MYLVLLLCLLNLNTPDLSEKEIIKCYHMSYDYEKMENYEDAIKAIYPVYKAFPDTYTVNLRLGWLYYLNGSYANSISHYKASMKACPNAVEAMLGLTLPLMAQGKWQDTEKQLHYLTSIDFFNYYGNLRLAISLKHQNKNNEAIKITEKMLSIYPSDVSFLQEKAENHAILKDFHGAHITFQSVLILDPNNIPAKEYFKKHTDEKD